MKRRNFLSAFFATLPLLISARKLAAVSPGRTKEQVEVINAGIGGNTTLDLLERIEKDCLIHNPDLTILMVGTNDMNSRKYIPIMQYEKNLREIIRKILKSKSNIVLMNLLPVYEPYLFTRHDPAFYNPEGHKERLAQMNLLIEKIAGEYQLSFLDIHRVFEKIGNIGLDKSSLIKNMENSNVADGLHPTDDGYRVIGLLVHQHLKYNKMSASKIVCFGDSITHGDGGTNGNSYPAYLKKLIS